MLGYDAIQITALALAAIIASVIVVSLLRAISRSRSSRRRQNRLSNAFDRASYVRRHGSVPVGSQYGIYEDRVRSVNSLR